MIYLTKDIVVEMHESLISTSGGMAGGGQRGADYEGVEAAIQAVENSYYESVTELAAAYAVYIIQGHVFADGNKRTASAAMFTFLKVNAATPSISDEAAASMTIELQMRARSGERTGDLIRWVASQLGNVRHR